MKGNFIRRKKPQIEYYIDPRTGRRLEFGSQYNLITGEKIYSVRAPQQQRRHRKFRSSYRRRKKPYLDQFFGPDKPGSWILGVTLGIGGIYLFVIAPFVSWLKTNLLEFISVILLFGAICCVAISYHVRRQKKFEASQRAKGLVKFVNRKYKTNWGTPLQVKEWQKIDMEEAEKEKTINQIIGQIDLFIPAARFQKETEYQFYLHQWLKKTFPHVKRESQRGRSRPDLKIGNIAIEVKGPTDKRGLDTIADKCMRYGRHFPEGLIIVLFDMHVYQKMYDEWLSSLQTTFPHVKVIKK